MFRLDAEISRMVAFTETRGPLGNAVERVPLTIHAFALVNVRAELIKQELVSAELDFGDRRRLRAVVQRFQPLDKGDERWRQFLAAAPSDWGIGLDLHLYKAAVAHIFGMKKQYFPTRKLTSTV